MMTLELRDRIIELSELANRVQNEQDQIQKTLGVYSWGQVCEVALMFKVMEDKDGK